MKRRSTTYVIVEDHRKPAEKFLAIYHLAVELTKADLRSRQFQRLLGPVWWIFEPSMMTLAFYFLTMQMGYTTGPNHFMFIFIGTTTWRFFSRCVENSVLLYVAYGSVIRQIMFPLLSSSLALLFTEFVFFCCGLATILVCGLAFQGLDLGVTFLFLPLLVACQAIFTLGVMIIASCVGVYIRDLAAPLTVCIAFAFFLSPGVYEMSKLPAKLWFLECINPFYYLFPAYRLVLMHDTWPALLPLVSWTAVGCLLVVGGLIFHNAIRPNLLKIL